MASHFDLEEQEQLDQLKHFWNTWGTLITSVLVVIFLGLAGWNGYQYWQKRQAVQAAALEHAVDVALAGKDQARADQAFAELKSKFGGTVQAAQTGLLVAKAAVDAGKFDDARAALAWVAETGDEGYKAIAKIRLSTVLEQQKQFDEGLKALEGSMPESFSGLQADRRGDLYAALGKPQEAVAQYQIAYKALDKDLDYRHLIEFKLNALGATPATVAQAKTTPSEN
ncbi:YfgM family protein [Comamonas terrae]|uniref:Ancillary SecYEG translocon subunit n=1 Tax=Comamonas terrae TaxID=673548 RepID=A0ABW5USJ7_9BURK|nr:tetratricopeptide repeat protein [Comamonas terrae]